MKSLRSRGRLYSLILAAFLSASPARAQVFSGTGNSHEVFVGSETETYLRYLDLTDTTSNAAWSIRPLSPPQLQKLSHQIAGTPWESRLSGFLQGDRFRVGLLSPQASLRFNSAFAYGSDDGAIWAGRGLTTAVAAGVYASVGPISLSLLPTAFRAENNAFPLFQSRLPCACGAALYESIVDRPQRFGTKAYQRVDPGQSTLRVDLLGLAAGVSSANEGWGPSVEYPFILGNNAAGFPHIFVGTSRPLPALIGHAQVRVIYGRLDQSNFSPVVGSKFYLSDFEPGRLRFASGLIAAFQPIGVDGLEIGGARFIHSVWPRSGIPSSYFRKPLRPFLKVNLGDIEQQVARTDNELASFFARWAFRPSGIEVYGEYGRDDSAYDLRDFLQEPDHTRAYSLGLAKVFKKSQSRFDVVRVEIMNFQVPPLATTTRGEGSIYWNGLMHQGHTNRGQLLGADIGVGDAAASTIRWDRYTNNGRWAVFYHRNLRAESYDQLLTDSNLSQVADVLQAIGYERVSFTRRFDVTSAVTLMRDMSRNFDGSTTNLNVTFALTLPQQR